MICQSHPQSLLGKRGTENKFNSTEIHVPHTMSITFFFRKKHTLKGTYLHSLSFDNYDMK